MEKTLILGKTEGKRRGKQRMRWLDSITDSMDINLDNLWEIVKEREVWYAVAMRLHKVRHDLVTEQQQEVEDTEKEEEERRGRWVR